MKKILRSFLTISLILCLINQSLPVYGFSGECDAAVSGNGSAEHNNLISHSGQSKIMEDPVQISDETLNDDGRRLHKLPDKGTYVDDQLIVKLASNYAGNSPELLSDYAQEIEFLFSSEGSAPVNVYSGLNRERYSWYCITIAEDRNLSEVWNEIEYLDGVESVDLNYMRQADSISVSNILDSDPYIHSQYWLENINAVYAWDKNITGDGVVVAVVDTGVKLDHPDLSENIFSSGYDFVNDDTSADDDDGHGTHVAGIIAAECNDVGVRGLAYGAKILPVKVLNANGSGSSSDIAEGIRYAADNGADIINLSLGGIGSSSAEKEAIEYARAKGCLVVASAGNDNLPTSLENDDKYGGVYISPANYPGVLTVMASDEDDELCSFSNYDTDPDYGTEYEIMAPGFYILSTTFDENYGYMSGTSMSSPVAAGAAALLMSMGCSAESAFNIISSCPKKASGRVNHSYAFLDLRCCVDKALQSTECNVKPVIGCCELNTVLEEQDFGHEKVNFSGMNTRNRLFFYNGKLISKLSLGIDNIGGSGNISLTGFVGGRNIDEVNCFIPFGCSTGDELSAFSDSCFNINGTPDIIDGNIEVQIFADGIEIYREQLPAYELKTLSDDDFNYSKQYDSKNNPFWTACLKKDNLTLGGSPTLRVVWVIDAVVFIPDNHSLQIYPGDSDRSVLVYECGEGMFLTDDTEGNLLFESVSLLSQYNFAVATNSEYNSIELFGCSVYDPYIEGISFAAYNAFVNNGYGPRMLKGNSIYLSGIYSCHSININVNWFWGNMVNTCSGAQITGYCGVFNNTFAENYRNYDGTVLKVYVSDYQYSTYYEKNTGFYENCVIGPMYIYRLANNSKTSKLAYAYGIYYQCVGYEDGDGNSLFPDSISDKIYCSGDSYIIMDEDELQSLGFNKYCPAFITKLDVLSYRINNENPYAIDYKIRFHFSTPVILPSYSYLDSCSDAMTGTSELSLSEDGMYCDAEGSAINYGEGNIEWYSLSNFYSRSYVDESQNKYCYFWNTVLSDQSMYLYPVCYDDFYYNSKIESVAVSGSSTCRTVRWYDRRFSDSYSVEIQRSINDSEYISIADNITGGSFNDKYCVDSGSIISYKVIVSEGKLSYNGYCSMLLQKSSNYMGAGFLACEFSDFNNNKIKVYLKEDSSVNGYLRFEFEDLNITSIDFSDEVKQSKIVFGAFSDQDNSSGKTIVYIGSGDDSHVFNKGTELFTVNVKDGSGENTVTLFDVNGLLNWGNNDSCIYKSYDDSVKLAYDSSGQSLQIYNSSDNIVLSAGYSSGGQIISLNAVRESYSVTRDKKDIVKIFVLDDNYNLKQVWTR